MYLAKSPVLIRRLFSRNLTWEIQSKDKNIFLTFDDGPTPQVTEEVLHILDNYQAKATFFCVGEKVKNHREIFNKIRQSGHSIGNHTFNHLKGWSSKTKDYVDNVKSCETYFKTKLFRPPYGKIKVSQILQLKESYRIIMWTVLSGDFDQSISKEKCLENAIKFTGKGSIVVFHDNVKSSKKMLHALPGFLAHFKEKGYEFIAIPYQ